MLKTGEGEMGIAKPLGKLEWKLLCEEVVQKRKTGGEQKGEMMVRRVVRQWREKSQQSL